MTTTGYPQMAQMDADRDGAARLTRPLMRYHGGKWRLAPWIISTLPPHRVYVESFGGAASVLLRKSRSYAEIYNDLDGCIVNLFRVVRERGSELVRALRHTPFARAEYRLAMRRSDDSLEDARRLVVRSFMGFGSDSFNPSRNSGFRANSNRSSTTPAHDWKNYPRALVEISRRLRAVVIECRDAREIMLQQDSAETLHYLDPPYVWATRMPRGHSPACYLHEMSDADHEALAAFVRTLKGMVVISGYDCPLYERLYGEWRAERKPARADGALPRVETLWFSPNCPAAARQGTLGMDELAQVRTQ